MCFSKKAATTTTITMERGKKLRSWRSAPSWAELKQRELRCEYAPPKPPYDPYEDYGEDEISAFRGAGKAFVGVVVCGAIFVGLLILLWVVFA